MKGISIVICTYNGEKRLTKTLEFISNIRFEENWELIVVNNRSTDFSEKLIETFFFDNKHVKGSIVYESNAGLTNARKAGWRNSNYDIILFCDDDNWLESNYLKVGFDLFKNNNKIGVLGGLGKEVSDGIFPDWFPEFSHSYAVGRNDKSNGLQKYGSAHYGAGCFFLKKALDQIDELGFNLVLSDRKGKELVSGGDTELCFVVQLLGYELWFDDRLMFFHYISFDRLSWSYYLKLKSGIAQSYPLLESYKIFFSNRQPNQGILKICLFKGIWYVSKGYLLCIYRSFFNPSKLNQVKLITLNIKFLSFFKNYRKTISHYNYLKKMFT